MLQLLFLLHMIYFTCAKPKDSIHIVEDLPIGSSIYTFSTDGCKTASNAGTYRFVDSQKNSNDFFLIDPYTGRVTTKKLIDRDDFCVRRMCACAKCAITLEVLCVNAGQIYFNDLSIIIDDRNDHAPQFPKSSLTIDVLENVPLGYLIPIDIANDLDYGNYSVQGYRLLEENSTNKILRAFQIEYSKKNDLLALRLIRILDRELYHSLDYVIQAYDGGQPQALTGRLNIHVNILDVNDMSPVFDQSDIHVLLSESTSVGSLVARMHASDGDTGPNGLIDYTIVSLDPPTNGTFLLSKDTGEIRLGKQLDYEKEKSYRIRVKAQDNGPQQGSMPAFAMVRIDIKDENDNYPLIAPSFNDDKTVGVEHVANSSIIKIRENTANATFLGHISISDLDQGDNGRISWSLESNESISVQKLFNTEAFLMFTSRVFDREEQSLYQIQLAASDHGVPSLSNTLNFTLVILDENDNAPKFDQDAYSINITETTPVNSTVLRVHATDADESNTANSHIEYRLDNQTIFALNSTTGELYLLSPLDRETRSEYELDIIALDHGQPRPLSTTVRCLIHVMDINDNYPIFDLSEYIFEIPETWSHLSPIGHVHATDADDSYGELSYTLVHNETTMTDEWPFELTSNGTLYLKATSVGLDYEQRSIYRFFIAASDHDGLNASVPVSIHILNRNDYCPELLHNSSVLFYNTDLSFNDSLGKSNQFPLDLVDGDNDTCTIELLNFNDIFRLETIERNQFLLQAQVLPEREYYVLQFRLRDVINETADDSCVQYIELVLTTGTNETNQTLAMDTAREYLDALHLVSQHKHSYFDLTLLNFILIFILLSIGIIIGLISIKLVYLSSNSRHRRKLRGHRNDINLLYRLQGPTETQLPLLANGPGEQSLTSSLIISGGKRLSQDENVKHSFAADDPQQRLLCQLNPSNSTTKRHSNEFRTFAMKSNNSAYDIIGDIIHSSAPPSSYPAVLNNDYECTSINMEQSRFLPSDNPSNVTLSPDGQLITVTYFSSPEPDSLLTSSNTLSRTLKTFSYNPVVNGSGNESSKLIVPRLAEHEVIEV